MNVSFYCKHCGKYLRKGNHSECKRLLREQSEDPVVEEHRLSEGRARQQRFAQGNTEYESRPEGYCFPDESW